MTNKQNFDNGKFKVESEKLIINDIDVSGCEKQGETINGITCGKGERIRLANEIITKHKLCKDSPNCYYKQLKRKEQECEELKKTIDDLLHKPEIRDKILWKIDNEVLLGSKDAYIYKLGQTLTEIKEIAEDESYIGFWDEQISEIRQKISEVQNG